MGAAAVERQGQGVDKMHFYTNCRTDHCFLYPSLLSLLQKQSFHHALPLTYLPTYPYPAYS